MPAASIAAITSSTATPVARTSEGAGALEEPPDLVDELVGSDRQR